MPGIIELMKSGEWKDTAKGLYADSYGVERTTVTRAAKEAKAILAQTQGELIK